MMPSIFGNNPFEVWQIQTVVTTVVNSPVTVEVRRNA
jgi:hypothetical protein